MRRPAQPEKSVPPPKRESRKVRWEPWGVAGKIVEGNATILGRAAPAERPAGHSPRRPLSPRPRTWAPFLPVRAARSAPLNPRHSPQNQAQNDRQKVNQKVGAGLNSAFHPARGTDADGEVLSSFTIGTQPVEVLLTRTSAVCPKAFQ